VQNLQGLPNLEGFFWEEIVIVAQKSFVPNLQGFFWEDYSCPEKFCAKPSRFAKP